MGKESGSNVSKEKKYREENREKIAKHAREYYQKNREEILMRIKQRRKKNDI